MKIKGLFLHHSSHVQEVVILQKGLRSSGRIVSRRFWTGHLPLFSSVPAGVQVSHTPSQLPSFRASVISLGFLVPSPDWMRRHNSCCSWNNDLFSTDDIQRWGKNKNKKEEIRDDLCYLVNLSSASLQVSAFLKESHLPAWTAFCHLTFSPAGEEPLPQTRRHLRSH